MTVQERLIRPRSRTHFIAQALAAAPGTSVTIMGWVATKSSIGGIKFATIRDGSGYIQIACKKDRVSPASFADFEAVTKESAVAVEGVVREDKRAPSGREISVTGFWTISLAEDWPITRSAVKSHSSFLYDKRHLAIRGRKASAVIRIRSEIVYAAFDHFVKNGFTLISAPSIVQNAVEGGSTLFEINYFGKKAYLSQSAQLYEEAALAALGKVFIFQPAFRAEKSKTSKHLTEFWMIEAEQAFAGQKENMDLQENLLSSIVRRVLDRRVEELKTLGRTLKECPLPFPRISYDEVCELAKRKGLALEWGDDIPSEVEMAVSASQSSPLFITDYPLSARSFYHMTYPDRPTVTESADLIAPEGYGELATGGRRIEDYNLLMDRIKGQNLDAGSFGWYLELRKYGMPVHSGFGMGVERVTRWLGGLKHIRAASLFPRTMTRVSP